MITSDNPEKTDLENNKMKNAKTIKRKPAWNENTKSEEEVCDAYFLHHSDISVGTKPFLNSDEEDFGSLTMN